MLNVVKPGASPGDLAGLSIGDLDAWAASSPFGLDTELPVPPGFKAAGAPPSEAPISAKVAAPAPDAASPAAVAPPPASVEAAPSVGAAPAQDAALTASSDAVAGPPSASSPPAPEPAAPTMEAETSAASVEPSSTLAAEPVSEPPPPAPTQQPAATEEGVDLPAASGELQLTDTWDFVGWQAESTQRAAVDLPSTAQGEPPDLQLAEAWEYARWERAQSPPETASAPAASPALASPPAASPPSPDDAGPVGFGAIRELLEKADRDAAVGKALLRYSEGRFSRAFLFVEQLDTAMVWRGIGEGSDDPGLAALRVDLQEPSVLRRAVEQRAPVHFDAPEGPLDEALYAALSPRSPYMIIAPIFAAGRVASFLYVESALEPLSSEAEAELAEAATCASRAYERIRAR
jgi:hypothetical protein